MVKTYDDLIKHTELEMIYLFEKKSAMLKIAYLDSNYKKNITMRNDCLYKKLLDNHIFPIIKLRKLSNF
jgi:hypothetical protein